MRTVTVTRSHWFRGHGPHKSYLLDGDGNMCCLGFDALNRGLTPAHIQGMTSPARVVESHKCDKSVYPDFVEEEVYEDEHTTAILNSKVAGQLMRINDDIDLTEAEREHALADLAATIGIAFVFEG